MFTGIVHCMGLVTAVEETPGGRTLVIDAGKLGDVPVGGSISVSGACLTVVTKDGGQLGFDVVAETLARTTLGNLALGSAVNLEQALAAGARVDGHFVQGHVDGTGTVSQLESGPEAVTMTISHPNSLGRYIVEKGSIAVDGVSLTVASRDDAAFTVALIPHTMETTTLGLRKPGDAVNLEVDVLAKYVESMLESR